jgi:hypothetical protein
VPELAILLPERGDEKVRRIARKAAAMGIGGFPLK